MTSRAEVEALVVEQLSQLTQIPSNKIALDDRLLEELKLDGDDFTFVLVPSVSGSLRVRVPVERWSRVHTLRDAVDAWWEGVVNRPGVAGGS